MTRLPTFFLCTLGTALLIGCAAVRPSSEDIDVSGSFEETFSLDGIRTVVVRCYCPRRTIVQEPSHPVAVLRLTGRLQSTGYHGKQHDPESALRSMLQFTSRVEGDSLVLEGRNGTYMHHAFGVSELWLSLPSDRALRIEPVSVLGAAAEGDR